MVHGAQQRLRELVAHGQDKLQVRHRSLGPLRVGRECGQGEPAEEVRQAEFCVSCLVQLGQRGGHVGAEAGLEEPGERQRQRLIGVGVGFLLEIGVSVGVRAGRGEPGGESDDSRLVCAGPARGHFE